MRQMLDEASRERTGGGAWKGARGAGGLNTHPSRAGPGPEICGHRLHTRGQQQQEGPRQIAEPRTIHSKPPATRGANAVGTGPRALAGAVQCIHISKDCTVRYPAAGAVELGLGRSLEQLRMLTAERQQTVIRSCRSTCDGHLTSFSSNCRCFSSPTTLRDACRTVLLSL